MAVRKIVKIDEAKCNGCGECESKCAEGALRIVDGKARLLKEEYCDGLGACLGTCPQDAITVEERESEEFDQAAVEVHMKQAGAVAHGPEHAAGGCPGSRAMQFKRPAGTKADPAKEVAGNGGVGSELGHWPVQLALVPVEAEFYQDAELVLTADCAAYAAGDFHRRFLKGRAVAIACPKLDDLSPYVEKLAEILRRNRIRGLVLIRMEVPCCGGIVRLGQEAAAKSGRVLPIREVTLGVDGEVRSDELSVAGAK
jgi:NAD-dependent dihydropyrimidine dehydrogenase PreA subunit